MKENNYKKLIDDGIYELNNGNVEHAIELISKSIELKNDWEISYFYRAVAFHSIKKFDEAILDYTKSIKLNPKMIDAYYNRAKILLEREDISKENLQKIVDDLEIAIGLDNNFLDALFAMACAKKKQEKYQEALEYLDKVLEICPDAINARALKKLLLQKYL